MLIEKAATEAAIRDIDEALAQPLAARRKAQQQGKPYVDQVFAKSRYPAALPETLRPTQQSMDQKWMVYEAFQRAPRQPSTLRTTSKC